MSARDMLLTVQNPREGWTTRHNQAVRSPRGAETPIVRMLEGWVAYAQNWRADDPDAKVGEDYVLGPEWARVGAAIRGLLNGETGELDCGTLDGLICTLMTQHGINPDMIP